MVHPEASACRVVGQKVPSSFQPPSTIDVPHATLDDLELHALHPGRLELAGELGFEGGSAVPRPASAVEQQATVARFRFAVCPGLAGPAEFRDQAIISKALPSDEAAVAMPGDTQERLAGGVLFRSGKRFRIAFKPWPTIQVSNV